MIALMSVCYGIIVSKLGIGSGDKRALNVLNGLKHVLLF